MTPHAHTPSRLDCLTAQKNARMYARWPISHYSFGILCPGFGFFQPIKVLNTCFDLNRSHSMSIWLVLQAVAQALAVRAHPTTSLSRTLTSCVLCGCLFFCSVRVPTSVTHFGASQKSQVSIIASICSVEPRPECCRCGCRSAFLV